MTAQSTVFTDHFEDGAIANSDHLVGFWTAGQNQGTLVERNGNLHFAVTAGSQKSPWIRSAVSPEFNFFNRPLAFSVRGLRYSSTPAATEHAYFQLMVASLSSSSASLLPDAIGVRIRANNQIVVGWKMDDATRTLFSGRYVRVTYDASAAVTGFTLTVRTTGWTLIASLADESVVTLSGLFPANFTRANWDGQVTQGTGSGSGDSAVILQLQNAPEASAEFSVDNFLVTDADER
jgi:hypothetical protein